MTWSLWFLLAASNVIHYVARQLLINAVLQSKHVVTSGFQTTNRTPMFVTAGSDSGRWPPGNYVKPVS
jgi:hypothetical protein